MTNEEVIRFLAKTLQVDFTRKVTNNKRPYYVLRITTKHEIVMILEALKPWLRVKKEHAQIILEFIALKKQEGLTRKEIVSKRAELYLKIRQLNLKGRPFNPDELRSDLEDCVRNYFKNK